MVSNCKNNNSNGTISTNNDMYDEDYVTTSESYSSKYSCVPGPAASA